METLTKRILAIVIIAAIGTGIGVGAWYFLLAPGAGEYVWGSKDCPGAPAGLTSDLIIKFGCAGDTGEIQGDANYEGVYFAAKTINEGGGVTIDGTTYYIGVTREDTDESNPNLVTSRGIAAAERLVYNKKIDFAVGGFRSEALLAYQEVFMDNKIIFINTGAATDIFCANVKNYYDRYKYFFRFMPINSSALSAEIVAFLLTYQAVLNATYAGGYGGEEIDTVGILAEDLTWTEGMTTNMPPGLAYYSGGKITVPAAAVIRYDVTLSAADMNTHLQTMTAQGVDILIPTISAQGGIMMMQQYAILQPNYLIIGIDVQSQLDTFWAQSGGDCIYETIMQTIHRCNKSATTISFWDAFIAHFGHEPLYIACGSHDAVMGIIDAAVAQDSLDALDIIAEMETWTRANPHPGVSGGGAWWPDTHDLVEGWPFSYTMWVQWQADSTKVVVPAYGNEYPNDRITPMGTYQVPPWVHTAWSTPTP